MNKDSALAEIMLEHHRATQKFPPFRSVHEGYAIILEELEELWQEIKKKERDKLKLQKEAVQVAAMAYRFLVDCIDS